MSEFADIQRALGRIEGKQDAMLVQLERGTDRMDKHDKRIGSLERSRHWVTGVAAGIGALIGIGSGHLPKL